ncbi:MAG: peptidase dimerization protein [Gemmatimonadetes bacterium]|nr:MAG: peptidase dimerization protein [Gemmatimonadota bacterium]
MCRSFRRAPPASTSPSSWRKPGCGRRYSGCTRRCSSVRAWTWARLPRRRSWLRDRPRGAGVRPRRRPVGLGRRGSSRAVSRLLPHGPGLSRGVVRCRAGATQRAGDHGSTTASVGARAANAHPLAGECRWLIDGEPTDNRLAAGSKGSLRLTLCTAGVPAHSAYPERGRSAIDSLLDVLEDVRRATWPTHPLFGETTVNIGVIAGGTRPNVVAADARADLQVRLVTEAPPVQALLEHAVRDRARIDYLTAVPPLRLATVPGFETCVVRFTTDIPHLTNWGTPLLLGPGSILDAHSAHERISEAELAEGADAYVRLVHALAVRKAEV